jgi:hypothetical protein
MQQDQEKKKRKRSVITQDFNYIAIIRGGNSTKGLNIYRN